MKRKRYSEQQIIRILKEAEAGIPVAELSRQNGFSQSAFYKWKAKYSGMVISALKHLKELEDENTRQLSGVSITPSFRRNKNACIVSDCCYDWVTTRGNLGFEVV